MTGTPLTLGGAGAPALEATRTRPFMGSSGLGWGRFTTLPPFRRGHGCACRTQLDDAVA
jgi:hypothetical protein